MPTKITGARRVDAFALDPTKIVVVEELRGRSAPPTEKQIIERYKARTLADVRRFFEETAAAEDTSDGGKFAQGDGGPEMTFDPEKLTPPPPWRAEQDALGPWGTGASSGNIRSGRASCARRRSLTRTMHSSSPWHGTPSMS